MQTSTFYFDQFELDLNSYQLRKSGRAIKLEKLPMELLILLAESQGQLVTREQIIERLWGDNVFVDTRQGINTAVRKLRIALQDDSEHPRLLQTVPGRGYRLLAPVSGPMVAALQNVVTSVQPPPATPIESSLANAVHVAQKKRWPMAAMVGGLVVLLAIGSLAGLLFFRSRRTVPAWREGWEQITKFSDSATQPALSPDGHMIAFIRGPETFVTPGEIYVKILPDGEPVQLTHDGLHKMAPVFSSDGSRIAYTATKRSLGWNTWVVPVLGGEPRELLPNAAALSWLDRQHVMFSEMRPEDNMGIVTATESRAEERDIYVPTHWGMAWGMAHRSWISPDGKWVLVSEMDIVGWAPCRVVPFDGSSSGETAGPRAARCTYAGWTPDGRTMFFSADVGDGYHIWRQDFPKGVPKQLTFGPTEEEGIAVSPDGRSLITCAGIRESTVWLHDSHGDRQISGEGYASVPGMGFGSYGTHSLFSPDGKRLFYLVRRQGSRVYTFGELWMADLDTGKNEVVLPGILMGQFEIAPDGDRVIFTSLDAHEITHVWMASLEHRTPPKQLTSSPSHAIYPGPGGDVYFRVREGGQEFLYRIGPKETVPRKIFPEPVSGVISPHGEWLLFFHDGVIARPTRGGLPIRICQSCELGWGPDGKFIYLRFRDLGELGGGKTLAFELPPGKDLPVLPRSGLNSAEDTKGLKVAAEIDMTGKGIFAAGPDASTYVFTRLTVQRNLYRIPLQ